MDMRRKLFLLGGLLLAAALLFAGHNVWTARRAADAARTALAALEQRIGPAERTPDAAPKEAAAGASAGAEADALEVGGQFYIGILALPTLELSLPVLRDCGDALLRTAPGRYSGSAAQNDLILAGHNYVGHFGRLDRLRAGDAVRFTDVNARQTDYTVTELLRIGADDAALLAQGEWDLTLFTCTLDGLERIVVRCARAG